MGCHDALTQAERQRQYERLVASGLPEKTISAIMPRCGSCVTAFFMGYIKPPRSPPDRR
jgi:hypothetical protein